MALSSIGAVAHISKIQFCLEILRIGKNVRSLKPIVLYLGIFSFYV